MKTLSLVLVMLLAACSSQPESEPADDFPPIVIAVDTPTAASLADFPRLQLIVVDDITAPLLDGRATMAISQTKLSDDTMGLLSSKAGKLPTMTILTAAASDSQADSLLEDPWYFYRLKVVGGFEASEAQLAWLLSDEAQQQLADRGLVALPEPMRQRARVALGLEPPAYAGGYR